MKKIVSSLGVAAFLSTSGLCQAVTMYEKDNFSYELKGDWQIQLRQDYGVDQDLDVEFDDLELKNRVTYKLGDKSSAFGQLDVCGIKAADESDKEERLHLEEAYLGYKYDAYSVLMGKTNNPADKFGVHKALEDVSSKNAFKEAGRTDGDDLVMGMAEFKAVQVMVSQELEPESEKSSANGKATDLFVAGNIGDLKLQAAYQAFERYKNNDLDLDIWGLSASYDFGVVQLGADYSDAQDVESVWNISAWFPMKPISVGVGYISTDYDVKDTTVAGWYLTGVYKFPKANNVHLFVEISDTDADNVDMGYMAGIRILF